jgi:multidrug efflux system membrane fusion protein
MNNGMKKSTLIPAAAAVVVVMLAVGCSAKKNNPVSGAPVLVTQAFTTNLPVQIDPPPVGHVMPVSTATVHSQIGGIISEVHFKEGSEVKSNDLLFTIDPRPSQAALDQARANLERDTGQLEYQKANFSRDQKLLAAKIISQDQSDTDKASLDAATGTVAADKAAITNALLNLEFCQIRSPIDGKTGSLLAFAGNVVKAPDDVLLTINQIHPIYVQFAVPEQYLPEIKKQMHGKALAVQATFENMDGPPPQGDLTFVDNAVDMTTGTILLKATFPNEDNSLWPGQFVNVTLTLSELTNAVVVPSQVVQVGQNGQFLYVVKSDPTNAASQIVEMRPVETGISFNNETVVTKGLQAGETVVTDGQLRLAPGVKVTVKSSDFSSKTNAP